MSCPIRASCVAALLLCASCKSPNETRDESYLRHGTYHPGTMQDPQAAAISPEQWRQMMPQFTELFPGVHAAIDAKIVEFDAIVSPMLMDDPKAPLFFVETLVCAPDTREHESLLVTNVKPSHLHAAMLAAGFTPGAPGLFKFEKEQTGGGRFVPVDATGDRLRVDVFPADASKTVTGGQFALEGQKVAAFPGPLHIAFDPDPRTWLINVADRGKADARRFGTDTADANHGWVFAGSSMRKVADKSGAVQEVYDADGTGIIIGLCCFGSEVIAWSRTFSHDASIDEPEWIADFSRTPPPGTPVRVRVQKAAE